MDSWVMCFYDEEPPDLIETPAGGIAPDLVIWPGYY